MILLRSQPSPVTRDRRVPSTSGTPDAGADSSSGSRLSGFRGRRRRAVEPASLPRISRPILLWFTWYCRRYIRRHFHELRITNTGFPRETPGMPLVILSNHASWWDPLVGLVIKAEFFPRRTLYAPIDAAMLDRYRMFSKLGFFGVKQNSPRGAAQFLQTSELVLDSPDNLLAVTPQSRFADVRERPIKFAAGLGHLAARVGRAAFLPIAIEYSFWNERLPEILVHFGSPVVISGVKRNRTHSDWTEMLERSMESTQNTLSSVAQRRDPSDFQTILKGGAGQGGIYDLWRWLRAKLRGQTFHREHI